MGHVAIGVDHHQEGYGGDNHQHQGGQVVDGVAHFQAEVTGRGPLKHLSEGFVALYLTPQQQERQHHRCPRQGDNKDRRWLPQLAGGVTVRN